MKQVDLAFLAKIRRARWVRGWGAAKVKDGQRTACCFWARMDAVNSNVFRSDAVLCQCIALEHKNLVFFIRHFVLQYCACIGIIWFTHRSYWNRVDAWIIENMDDCSVILFPSVAYDMFLCCYLSSWFDACFLQSGIATNFSWVRHVQSPFPVSEMKSIAFVNFFCFVISLISQIDGEDSSSPNDLCPTENQKVGHLSVELHIDFCIVMH